MPRKLLFAVALAALLVPAAAFAKSIEVEGPASLQGRGGVRGALHGERAATVNLRMAGGQIRVTGAAAGLEVRCAGRKVQQGSRTNRRLETVVCKARGPMLVAITSKRFRFAAQSRAFSVQVPEGLSGTLHGNIRLVDPPAEEQAGEEAAPSR
jgi:RNase P/RNase MRP subunit p29